MVAACPRAARETSLWPTPWRRFSRRVRPRQAAELWLCPLGTPEMGGEGGQARWVLWGMLITLLLHSVHFVLSEVAIVLTVSACLCHPNNSTGVFQNDHQPLGLALNSSEWSPKIQRDICCEIGQPASLPLVYPWWHKVSMWGWVQGVEGPPGKGFTCTVLLLAGSGRVCLEGWPGLAVG